MSHALIDFIGGGNMASAMIRGLETLPDGPTVRVCDPVADVRARHERAGRRVVEGVDALSDVRLVVLAIKPQKFSQVAPGLAATLTEDALVISVMAGISCAVIEAALPRARVVRVMPNTPMSVGRGMAGVAPGARARAADVDLAEALCAPSAEVLRVDEAKLDAVTAVSGSGPAYFFRFCEVLMEAAQAQCGFSEDEARLLVSQTAQGSMAYLAAQDGFPAARLRAEVTSPGGTTAAALAVFDGGGLASLTRAALAAAMARAAELNANA